MVGGGVIGAAVAYYVARDGVSVTLLEREQLATGASGTAAGMLLPIGESDGESAFLEWGLRGLALFPDLADELLEHSGVDPEYEPSGALHVAYDAVMESVLRTKSRRLAHSGLEWLDPAEVRARRPQLGGQIFGALWSPREGHVQSAALTRAFAAAAVALGARVEEGVTVKGLLGSGDLVTGVSTGSGARPAGAVVLCAGAWSAHCASWLAGSWRLPIEPERGQVAILEPSEHRFREIIAGTDLYLVPKRDGSLVVGATQERVGFEDHVTAEGVSGLLSAAFTLAPELSECGFREARSGLRPATPDGMPVIGAVPDVRALFVAAGHFRNGILLSPVTGRLVADRIAGRESPGDADPFDPGRFASAPGPEARSTR